MKHLLQDLDPPFCIQNSGTDQERLPTASTCMNLLKLPDFRVKKNNIFTDREFIELEGQKKTFREEVKKPYA